MKKQEQEQKNEIIQSRLEVVDLLSKTLSKSTIMRINNWLQANADKFTYKNEKYNPKSGDIITFKNGEDIPMRSKIIAFNAENGNAYVFWDCFWVDLDLEKRLIKQDDCIENY